MYAFSYSKLGNLTILLEFLIMGSPQFIYCSYSDDKPMFARNQRTIKEHRVKEEQSDTQANFCRLIDEVAKNVSIYVSLLNLRSAEFLYPVHWTSLWLFRKHNFLVISGLGSLKNGVTCDLQDPTVQKF